MRLHPHLLSFVAPLIAVAGCDGCRNDRPYTPYTLDATAPSSSSSSSASSPAAPPSAGATASPAGIGAGDGSPPGPDAGADGGAFTAVQVGTAPPEGGKRWPLDGGRIAEAPAGRSLETGLVVDADGDGARDLLAWARAPDGLRGELVFMSGAPAAPAGARTLAALPAGIAPSGCTPRASLAQISALTVGLAITPSCPDAQQEGASRWLALLRTGAPATPAPPTLALEVRIRGLPGTMSWAIPAGTAPGTMSPAGASASLDLAVATSDRDGDGREDLEIRVTFTAGPEPGSAPSEGQGTAGEVPGSAAGAPGASGAPDAPDAPGATGATGATGASPEASGQPSAEKGPSSAAGAAGTTPRVAPLSVPFWFLDRPSGLARDASQPGAALKALADALLGDAGTKARASEVPARAQAIRKLRSLLCEDAGGSVAVTMSDGPTRCGELDLDKTLGRAETRARGR
ncbi:hypothetical protein [Chondromyces apiculatus]|uniref:Uncharacterized protein n=1 Tax=Chondromyces apiculatus DSM 436 TaxID=1192034 RepID=A0A017SUX6_9BACT|nr:hypothetical protein [Chondromyces apiculatus]EYF00071.1 Hypothetical protein CAP_1393 [Chondromyces apiculatus DSM 436]